MRRVLLTTISLLVGIALVCVGLGLTAVVKAASALSQQTQRERTLLDLRMESSREIRQALAKPLPHSEPLPPITARLRHAKEHRTVHSLRSRQQQLAATI